LLVLDRAEQQFRFEGLPRQAHPPALSLLRHFSAPVKLEMGRPTSELVHLFACDSDPFARWDAGQSLWRQAVLARAVGLQATPGAAADVARFDSAAGSRQDAGIAAQPADPHLEQLDEQLIEACGRILADPSLSEASRCALMSLPGSAELDDAMAEPDPPALFLALRSLERRLGSALAQPLQTALERCTPQWPLAWPEGNGDRMLTGLIWTWRVAAGDPAAIASARAAVDGGSMTLARAGLRALLNQPGAARQEAMAAFYERWQHKPVILDAWFALEAAAPGADGLERVALLLAHPRFDPNAPNSVRAVLGGLAGNALVFHSADGRGYRFMAEQIAWLDARNPIIASRLAKVFSRWRSYGSGRSAAMHGALEQLAAAQLSTNTREVVGQCLAQPPQGR
jgi:aminopeptidase N